MVKREASYRLHSVLKKQRTATKQETWTSEIADAPVFYPTKEEFKDPMRYISSIEPVARNYGICKIVPPVTPTTPPALVIGPPSSAPCVFDTRQQWVCRQEWHTFSSEQFYDGRNYTLPEYEAMANKVQQDVFGTAGVLPPRMIEEAYWRQMERGEILHVEYGNDVEGTAFSDPASADPLASSPWNLQVLPTLPTSTLRLVADDIPGVTSPMLYVGMLFSAFAWHVEDQYLYSINYQHLGAAKTWYGVPCSGSDRFEEVVETKVYRKAAKAAAKKGHTASDVRNAALKTLIRKTTVFSPKLLMEAGVPVCRAVQAPGEYIITFPRAYHAGFSNGFCVGEAANFALGNWFRYGAEACARYRRIQHPVMLSQEYLLCSEAQTLACMGVAERRSHVNRAAGPEFISVMDQYSEDIARMVAAGAKVQAAQPSSNLRHPCDVCGFPCYIARVLLTHNGLSSCCRCSIMQPKYLLGATILCHDQYSEFQRVACQLQDEAACSLDNLASQEATTLQPGSHHSQSPSNSDCTVVPGSLEKGNVKLRVATVDHHWMAARPRSEMHEQAQDHVDLQNTTDAKLCRSPSADVRSLHLGGEPPSRCPEAQPAIQPTARLTETQPPGSQQMIRQPSKERSPELMRRQSEAPTCAVERGEVSHEKAEPSQRGVEGMEAAAEPDSVLHTQPEGSTASEKAAAPLESQAQGAVTRQRSIRLEMHRVVSARTRPQGSAKGRKKMSSKAVSQGKRQGPDLPTGRSSRVPQKPAACEKGREDVGAAWTSADNGVTPVVVCQPGEMILECLPGQDTWKGQDGMQASDLEWLASLDLKGTELARAASTRNGSLQAAARSHAASWRKQGSRKLRNCQLEVQ